MAYLRVVYYNEAGAILNDCGGHVAHRNDAETIAQDMTTNESIADIPDDCHVVGLTLDGDFVASIDVAGIRRGLYD